ncbi:MAG: hypothetical protein AAF518_12200 [Spirochaetota bacterium]
MQATQTLLFIFCLLSFFQCKSKHQIFIEEIKLLIEKEKFGIVIEKLQGKLKSQRPNDEILSFSKPKTERIMSFSNDRNRLIWVEDKKLIYRDLANPLVKTKELPKAIANMNVSAEGNYAIVAFPNGKEKKCNLRSLSLVEFKPDYNVATTLSCDDKAAIAPDGGVVYYFKENALYKEVTIKYNNPILLVPKEEISAPYPKILNKNAMFSIGKTFVIFSGNAGAYNLYWFNPSNNEVQLLAKKVVLPYLYYGNGKQAFIICGSIGKLTMRELQFSSHSKPSLTQAISVELSQTRLWQKADGEEFFTGEEQVFSWKRNGKMKAYPILCKRFWGVARNQIIYENSKGELLLANTEFAKEEWDYLRFYILAKEKKSEEERKVED